MTDENNDINSGSRMILKIKIVTLEVADPGNGEPWEWQTVGMVGSHQTKM